jgi:hypothetical protein
MKTLVLTVIMLLVLSMSVGANELEEVNAQIINETNYDLKFFKDWSAEDTGYELAVLTLNYLQYQQNLNNLYQEPFTPYGLENSVKTIHTNMLVYSAGNILISYFLPKKIRRYWQIGSGILILSKF